MNLALLSLTHKILHFLMFKFLTLCTFYLVLSITSCTASVPPTKQTAYPKREFRGAWIQCVNGQYLGKSPAEIRQMLSSQLDVLADAGINAIMFQVRAEGDALYKSNYEPWSRYLTGQQGVAPSDGWDPLAWMIDQCHQRNMECHAWINPYRAKTKGTTQLAYQHAANRYKERIFEYDGLFIFNPAMAENRHYTCMIVEDILRRYDVDGLHMDDYFYPYPVAGVPIPDQVYFDADPRGFRNIADWRRDNVNLLIQQLHSLIRNLKPWVKFGISPFGIYRNNTDTSVSTPYGSATAGLQNYNDLYADVLLWVDKGWIDYTIPQIYWNIGTKVADYDVLVRWWNDYAAARPVFVGQDVERTVKGADPHHPDRHQMQAKYDLQRSMPNIQGSCLWYAAAVVANPGNYTSLLRSRYHRYPALQPLMPFIDKKAPKRAKGTDISIVGGKPVLTWKAPKAKTALDRAISYVIYDFPDKRSINLNSPSNILGITRSTSFVLPPGLEGHTLIITALDRLQNESKGVKVKL